MQELATVDALVFGSDISGTDLTFLLLPLPSLPEVLRGGEGDGSYSHATSGKILPPLLRPEVRVKPPLPSPFPGEPEKGNLPCLRWRNRSRPSNTRQTATAAAPSEMPIAAPADGDWWLDLLESEIRLLLLLEATADGVVAPTPGMADPVLVGEDVEVIEDVIRDEDGVDVEKEDVEVVMLDEGVECDVRAVVVLVWECLLVLWRCVLAVLELSTDATLDAAESMADLLAKPDMSGPNALSPVAVAAEPFTVSVDSID